MAVVKWPSLQWYDADLKTWLNQNYETKLVFDSTPVYSVTLAEDTTATTQSLYKIPDSVFVNKDIRIIFANMYCPQVPSAIAVSAHSFFFGKDTFFPLQQNAYSSTRAQNSCWLIRNYCGVLDGKAWVGSSNAATFGGFEPPDSSPLFVGSGAFSAFGFKAFGDGVLLAGTRIVVYVGREV